MTFFWVGCVLGEASGLLDVSSDNLSMVVSLCEISVVDNQPTLNV